MFWPDVKTSKLIKRQTDFDSLFFPLSKPFQGPTLGSKASQSSSARGWGRRRASGVLLLLAATAAAALLLLPDSPYNLISGQVEAPTPTACPTASPTPAPTTERPNLILMLVDGNTIAQSPTMYRLPTLRSRHDLHHAHLP